MRLRDYLSVPYLLEAQSVEIAPDAWIRRVSYPELPGCMAQAPEIEDAIEELERNRMRLILAMLRSGNRPPVPRRPLRDCDPGGLSRDLGLGDEILNSLDRNEAELRQANKD